MTRISDKIIEARSGQLVDTSGPVWSVDLDATLDFQHMLAVDDEGDETLEAFADYIRFLIVRYRPRTVLNRFSALRSMLNDAKIRDALKATDSSLVLALVSNTKTLKPRSRYHKIAVMKAWYAFASLEEYAGFDPDVATMLQSTRFRQGRAGVAVSRQDPGQGPLTPAECKRLEDALWKAADEATLKTGVTLAGLLFYTFGFNPEHIRRLHEKDIAVVIEPGASRALRVPRVKKPASRDRASFFQVELSARLAALFDRQVAENLTDFPHSDKRDRPLFRPSKGEVSDAAYVGKAYFRPVCEEIVHTLGIKADGGAALHLYPRRLRYSFVSRAIANGATVDELVEMLDHRGTATIMQYFAARLDIVPRLDAALGPGLARLAAIACGRSAATERPTDSVLLETAPFACVTCPEWRPVESHLLSLLPAHVDGNAAPAFETRCANAARQLAPLS